MYEPTASTSVGLILSACDDEELNCAHVNSPEEEAEEPAGDGNLFNQKSMEEMVATEPKPVTNPAPAPTKPKTPQKPKGVWRNKIGEFVGNIFDSVMNEVESDR